ncbi:hypothetical protein LTR37_016887 [Vermiconidia calcicola]|uniref:Uncharacterized protein n=1 Tax=Vermiconidia calcicola TaxID=1690605 RepID=A0ACC3MLH8_9PEZI|nr:hypothetical protein LTR37_016887 [Vermiconidia calcicola]
MNIAAVPRIDSIVLTGLDFSMKPENARYEADKGFIKPFPEIKVMHTLKSLAVMVYNQEKLTPYFHGNVCEGRNSLAYFICAMHRQQAPQPKSHSRSSSVASTSSNSSAGSCKSTGRKKNCELPKLVTTSMLPLGYWDSLYYALVAEIRLLHSDLQQRFGFGCENGTKPLHHFGPDGTTDQPITAIDLASMLETAWYTLMDNRLVATLDDTVRMRRMREDTARRYADATNSAEISDPAKQRPPVIYGLMDVNALSPEVTHQLLWDRHAPEINAACAENFEDESMLTAYRAEMHAKQVEEGMAVSTPLLSAFAKCHCHRACVCKLKCDNDAETCTCQNCVHIYNLVHEQEHKKAELNTKYVKHKDNVPNQFLGAATNTLAQMQIAAMADPTPTNVQACYNVSDAGNAVERQVASRHRKRTNTANSTKTNNSDLVYVPEARTQHRGPKDAYPLGFYTRHSGERYPKLPPQTPNTSDPSGSTSITGNVMARKPVPPPITPQHPYAYASSQHAATQYQYQAPTPPSSSPYNVQTFAQAGQVTYPAIPQSQSQSMFTQSFPAAGAANPREVEGEVSNQVQYSDPAPGHNDPAQEYIGLLSRHPSSTNHPEQQVATSFPTLTRSVTNSPPKKHKSGVLPTLKTLNNINKPHPALPEPDFIAPRPALKQRYVSAGGNAKLSERAEIAGPAFRTAVKLSKSGVSSGAITKEELDAKMSNPEWVRKNFGDAAVMGMTPERKRSDESKRSSGGKKSGESARVQMIGDKRDRTSSGAGKRVAKLKRVFSRKGSESE